MLLCLVQQIVKKNLQNNNFCVCVFFLFGQSWYSHSVQILLNVIPYGNFVRNKIATTPWSKEKIMSERGSLTKIK